MKKLISKQLTAYSLQLFIVVSCMLLVVSLFGCGQIQPSGGGSLAGTWRVDYSSTSWATYTFNSDNTFSFKSNLGMYDVDGTYQVSGDTIKFTKTSGQGAAPGDKTYNVNGNILTLTDVADPTIKQDYIKQ